MNEDLCATEPDTTHDGFTKRSDIHGRLYLFKLCLTGQTTANPEKDTP